MSSRGVRIIVKGKVQGVWYRGSTQTIALDLGLTGWVMNQTDGSVLIEVFGDSKKIDRFVEQCREGPRHAIVDDVMCEEIPFKALSSFEVQRLA